MDRIAFSVLMSLLLLGGCRNRPTQFDPFLGKTTVPPPPTGSVGSQAPTGTTAYPASPPGWTGATTPAAPATGAPPAAVFPPNTSLPPPTPLSGPTAPPSNATPYQFTGSSNTPIRVVPPDPSQRSSFGSPGLNNGGIDIMQLPVKSPGVGGAPSPTSGATVVPPSSVPANPAVPTAGYSFDPNYSQLSGRLEYSALDQRWLLRYVAPGQKADRFGGVAVFVPGSSMAGINHGDFVTAQGRFEAVGSSSPVFTASGVTLQRR